MRRLFSFLLFAALVSAPAAFVRAENPVRHHGKHPASHMLIPEVKPVVATYDVYVGGIHLLTADVLFEEHADAYHAHMKGQTYGFWYRLVPWNTELDAEGKISDDRFIPVE